MSIGKRKRGSALPFPSKRKKKSTATIEEIKFDPTARQDYLSGFHKRKVQRAKVAKEEAIKREREEKIVARKQLRDERKADLAHHVEAVNSALRQTGDVEGDLDGDDDEGEESDSNAANETDKEEAEVQVPPRLDLEEEYIDEDKYTTVTLEDVNVTKTGLQKVGDESDAVHGDSTHQAAKMDGRAESGRIKARPIKTKKKKFKYESKADRKVTRQKERFGGRAQARARKGGE